MKKNYKNILRTSSRAVLLSLLMGTAAATTAQTSYSFTPASASGISGPTQGQANTAYAATNLAGLVNVASGIQSFTIPTTGSYLLAAYGAGGGNSATDTYTGGNGSHVASEFSLVAGDVLEILVGQRGGAGTTTGGNYMGGGGGGGSFIRINGVLAVAAGGGGGAGTGETNLNGFNGNPATITTAGNVANGSNAQTNGLPGNSGTGGTGGSWYSGAGGAGYQTNGTNAGAGNIGSPGLAYVNGGTGGNGATYQGAVGGSGGFGSGSGASLAGGGGGGYSGGAGGTHGQQYNATAGGGGGCYNSGGNPVAFAGVNNGDGQVVITSLCNVQVNGPTTICAGNSTTLSSTAVSNILWSTGSTASSIIVSPLATTQYTVSGNGSNNNCLSTIIFSVIVNPLPVIVAAVNPPMLCVGNTATVYASGAAINSYSWSTGPFLTNSVTANPIITTTYNVAGASNAGCVNNTVFTVNVDALSLSVAGNSAVCLGNSTSLTGSGGTNLSWTGYGPFATINPAPTLPTTYTLTGTDANNCTLTKMVTVVVNPLPVVTASASKTLACKGENITLKAEGASTYSWSASAGLATSAVVIVVPALDINYDYSVIGTDDNGCMGSATVSVKAELCTGIKELQTNNLTVDLYPNPNNGSFTIKAAGGTTLVIVNTLGQLIKTITLNESETFVASDFAKGVYFINGINNGLKVSKKFVVD